MLHKTAAQELAEKQEADELRQRIIDATKRVPKCVLEGSQQMAVAYKAAAEKAHKAASSKTQSANVHKMRDAWSLISGYYHRS
jgi:hypothetical protein